MKTIKKEIKKNDFTYFSVYVNKKNAKGHNEVYRLPKLAYLKYKKLGFDKAFFFFIPQEKNVFPGAYKINKVTFTNDKANYYTSKGIFTLPKYLHEKLPNKDYVIYSERVTRKWKHNPDGTFICIKRNIFKKSIWQFKKYLIE